MGIGRGRYLKPGPIDPLCYFTVEDIDSACDTYYKKKYSTGNTNPEMHDMNDLSKACFISHRVLKPVKNAKQAEMRENAVRNAENRFRDRELPC
jgi:hypothetical protein